MPEERVVRLKNEERKADHERWKEKAILVAVLAWLSIIALACLVVALIPGAPEEKKWAVLILTSIVSLGVGCVGGRASKPD